MPEEARTLFPHASHGGKPARRGFLSALVAGTVAIGVTSTAAAQQAPGLPRVAVIDGSSVEEQVMGADPTVPESELSPFARQWRWYDQEMRRLGYVDGRSIRYYRWTFDGVDDVAGRTRLAAEVVAMSPDVIVTVGSSWPHFLLEATETIPIVVVTLDPIESGFTTKLAQPDRNITGFARRPDNAELDAKLIQLLVQAAPSVRRLAWLYERWLLDDPRVKDAIAETIARTDQLGLQVSVEIVPIGRAPSTAVADVEAWLRGLVDQLVAGKYDGVLFSGGTAEIAPRYGFWAQLLREAELPSIAAAWEYAAAGGLMCYHVDLFPVFVSLAQYTDRIIRGARPQDLPFQLPTTLHLRINLGTARALGLDLPDDLLVSATELIE
jgi:putative ABC transport system substrate-binding protein